MAKRFGINIILILFCILLSGCYSTNNSESIGTLKVQENQETSTYLIFGFGLVKVVKPKDANVEIIRNYGYGFQFNKNSKTAQGFTFGIWADKTTLINPESNTVSEIKENIFDDEIKVEKY